MELAVRVHRKPRSYLTLTLDRTYTVATNAGRLNLLPQKSPYQGKMAVLYAISERVEMDPVNTMVSPRYMTMDNNRLILGYCISDVNFRLERAFGGIVFNTRNLTDRVNPRYGPKPGSEVFAGIKRSL